MICTNWQNKELFIIIPTADSFTKDNWIFCAAKYEGCRIGALSLIRFYIPQNFESKIKLFVRNYRTNIR